MPNETIFHADAKVTAGSADIDLWGGYASQSDAISTQDGTSDYEALFAGIGAKFDISEAFYVAGRYTYAGNQSDIADDVDDSALSRIQLGLGVNLHEKALLKVEYVNQNEGNTRLSGLSAVSNPSDTPPGPGSVNSWQGVTTELSFNF